ncbi:MAG: hypothetical protein KGZ69_06210 [Methylomonas sp.]|nr:hypothetical protein [Methylomonas sp.]
MARPDPEVIAECIKAVGDKYDADILAYVGFLSEPDDDRVLAACRKRQRKRKNVLLILSTPGGSADAAYRIARCLQRAYKCKSDDISERGCFFLYVHDMCKSAGTLLALGASALIMSQRAELGPIDVQLLNEEEVGERRSGLAPRQAMEMLATESGKAFFRMFRLLRTDGLHLPTKLAAESATKLAIGMVEPLYAQLDPIRMGETERFVAIAQEYGERLRSSNVKKDTIGKLLSEYPSHEFVIDREEAAELFERVEVPTDDLERIAGVFIRMQHPTAENMTSFIQFLNAQSVSPAEAENAETSKPRRGVVGAAKDASKRTPRPATAASSRGNGARARANGSGQVGSHKS